MTTKEYRYTANKEVRDEFRDFQRRYYRPTITVVADTIGVDYCNLNKWLRNEHDFSLDSLRLIQLFLDRH